MVFNFTLDELPTGNKFGSRIFFGRTDINIYALAANIIYGEPNFTEL